MRLYLKFVAMHLQSQMQYKISFFLLALGQFLVSFTALLGYPLCLPGSMPWTAFAFGGAVVFSHSAHGLLLGGVIWPGL